ncbi:hypothetical protein Btru_054642 [Bulinus truncatus]|nr:hypothetical protein Btru_054642 [Bulinus truncatus]
MQDNSTIDPTDYYYYYEQERLAEEDVRFIVQNANIPLFIIGVPNNILIIALILKMKYLGTASGLIIYLAIMDSLTLTVNMIQRQLYYHDILITEWGCKFYFSTALSFAAIANWTLVLISFERYLTICYPFQRQVLINHKGIKIGVVIGSLSLVVFVFLFQGIFNTEQDEVCTYHILADGEMDVVEASVIYALPFLFIAAFTIAVIVRIYVTSQRRSSVTSLPMMSARRRSSCRDVGQTMSATSIQGMEKSLSQLMLSAAVLYFALNILYCLDRFVLLPVYGTDKSRSLHVFEYLVRILRDINHALNLYVYLAFSKRVRSNLFKMLLPCPLSNSGVRSRSSSIIEHSETKSDRY